VANIANTSIFKKKESLFNFFEKQEVLPFFKKTTPVSTWMESEE